MRPIPVVGDREKIIKHKANGESVKNIAKWLMIGSSTVYQYWCSTKKQSPFNPNLTKETTTK